jgi:hypothetical protein
MAVGKFGLLQQKSKGQRDTWHLQHVTLGSFCARQVAAPATDTWHFRSRHLAVSDVDKWQGVIGPHGMVLANHGLTHGPTTGCHVSPWMGPKRVEWKM